jgi:Stress responsive A/B Barrel Domain
MTVRHIVLMSFPEGIDEDFIARMSTGLSDMAAAIPEVLSASWGRDDSSGADSWDYALVLDFADEEAYRRYRVHPAHERFIALFMRDCPIRKARVRYTFDARGG